MTYEATLFSLSRAHCWLLQHCSCVESLFSAPIHHLAMDDEECFTDSKTRLVGNEDEVQRSLRQRRPRTWPKIATGIALFVAYTAFVVFATHRVYAVRHLDPRNCELFVSRKQSKSHTSQFHHKMLSRMRREYSQPKCSRRSLESPVQNQTLHGTNLSRVG
jgi:hypothetical protein